MIFLLLGLLLIAALLFVIIMSAYFAVYKKHINKAIIEKNNSSHIKMFPPYIIAIILTVVFLIIFVYFISASRISHGGVGVTSLPLNEYLEEVDTPEISEWVTEDTNYDNKAYILKHRSEMVTHYLIYVPYAANKSEINVQQSTNLFGETLSLKIEATDGDRGNHAILVTYTGENELNLEINYGGQDIDCVISETEYSLELE